MAVNHNHHGPAAVLAENGLGQVSQCACGVMTLTVACVSLRFEEAAFDELAALIEHARMARRLLPRRPAVQREEAAAEGACVH